jgi:hypothetical protein
MRNVAGVSPPTVPTAGLAGAAAAGDGLGEGLGEGDGPGLLTTDVGGSLAGRAVTSGWAMGAQAARTTIKHDNEAAMRTTDRAPMEFFTATS